MGELKTINAGEFLLDSGLLFQINRDILHPLGLALAVDMGDEVKVSNNLWDYREDPEGILYSNGTLIDGEQKLKKFYDEFGTEKLNQRFETVGYITQQTVNRE